MPKTSSVAVKFLPSFTDVVFLAPAVLLCSQARGAKALLGDGDTGWHIRTGEWILSNRAVPYTDMFSFSKPGQSWFAWEWLWDVAFASLHTWGGMAAVIFVSLAVISFTFALVYKAAQSQSGNAVISAVIAILAIVASSLHWLARPHLFTFLFATIFFSILEKARPRALLIGLPILMVLWTNIHGGFIVGLFLLGIYAAGEAVRYCLSSDSGVRQKARRRTILFFQSLLLCLAATLCNPYGYQLHQHLVSYLLDGYQMANIGEFQSLNFHHPLSLVVELLMFLSVGTAFWSLVRGRFTHFLLLAFWLHLAIASVRNIPLLAILAAPLIAAALQDCLRLVGARNSRAKWFTAARRVSLFCSNIGSAEAIPRWHVVSLAAAAAFGAVLLAPAPPARLTARYDAAFYPERAIEAMKVSGTLDHIFTTDVWGGYLIYRMYPQVKVFVDGRSDFYGPAFGTSYVNVISVKQGWEAHLHEYGIDTVLLSPDSVLSSALKESKNWRCTYDDGTAIVFRPVDKVPAKDKPVSTAFTGVWRNRKVAATERQVRSGYQPLSGKRSERAAEGPLS